VATFCGGTGTIDALRFADAVLRSTLGAIGWIASDDTERQG